MEVKENTNLDVSDDESPTKALIGLSAFMRDWYIKHETFVGISGEELFEFFVLKASSLFRQYVGLRIVYPEDDSTRPGTGYIVETPGSFLDLTLALADEAYRHFDR